MVYGEAEWLEMVGRQDELTREEAENGSFRRVETQIGGLMKDASEGGENAQNSRVLVAGTNG